MASLATASERLGAFAASVRCEDLPPDAVHAAKRFLLDTLACIAGGWSVDSSVIARDTARDLGGPPHSSILLTGEKVSATAAVLANGVPVRALDLIDMYYALDHTHPCELTVVPALALGEMAGASGRDLIAAIVLGYEICMRMAETAGITARGFAGTATLGQFAAPAVAGRILGLDATAIAHAIGICGVGHTAVAQAYLAPVSMMKDALNALVAQGGVQAALLARRGFTGPALVLDGPRGFWKVMGSPTDAEAFLEGLGAPWRIGRCGLKDHRYAVVAWSHPAVEAVFRLREAHAIRAEQVIALRVRTIGRATMHFDLRPVDAGFTRHDAQFNARYILAAALTFGDLTPERQEHARDPVLQDLAEKVEIVHDPALDPLFPGSFPAIVEIVLTNGSTVTERIDHRRGDPANPISDADIETKFRFLSANVLAPCQADRVIDACWRADALSRVTDLTRLLAPAAAEPRP